MRYFAKILIALFTLFTLKSFGQSVSADSSIIWNSQKFRTILETVAHSYKDSVDIEKISETAFSAMLKSLDPYSDYFNKNVLSNYRSNYSSTVNSIGLNVIQINDTITVTAITRNSPSDKGGIIPGDRVIFINGLNTVKMPLTEFNSKTTKSDTLPVILYIKRNNQPGLLEFKLLPCELEINSVLAFFIYPGSNVGIIKSNRFAENANKEFKECISQLKSQGARSLIVDIRQHQGGNVEQSALVTDEFIRGGKTLTYLQGKNNDYYQKYESKDGDIAEDMALIVLVDNETMSAAEIFAGAIQDLDRGIISGTQTYGKGMAQKVWEFKDGTGFRLTIGDYFTPSGRNVQKNNHNKLELDESSKIQLSDSAFYQIQQKIAETGGKLKYPVYKTEKGRTILGDGGIFPDVLAKDDTTTLLSQVFMSKNIILETVIQFLYQEKENILKKYKNDLKIFNKEYYIDDEFLKRIEKVSRSKNIWNEKMFLADREFISNYAKSLIAYILWGTEGFYYTDLQTNKSIQISLNLIKDAEKMLNSNK